MPATNVWCKRDCLPHLPILSSSNCRKSNVLLLPPTVQLSLSNSVKKMYYEFGLLHLLGLSIRISFLSPRLHVKRKVTFWKLILTYSG